MMPSVSWNSYPSVSAYNLRLEAALLEAAQAVVETHPEVLGV